MRKILTLLICTLLSPVFAQKTTPKLVDKAKKSVVSVITYTKEGTLLRSGNGFLINNTGVGVSNYSLFVGAHKATIVDTDGLESEITEIMGADDIYDVIKFKVKPFKNMSPVQPITKLATVGSKVYLLPYSTKKEQTVIEGSLTEITTLKGQTNYYQFALKMDAKEANCPIVNELGEVIALSQVGSKTAAFGVGIDYINNLQVPLLASQNKLYRAISINYSMPENRDQALVSLVLAAPTLNASNYLGLVNSYIEKFPTSEDGYQKRAELYIYRMQELKGDTPLTEQEALAYLKMAKDDLSQLTKQSPDKAGAAYYTARMIYNVAVNYKNQLTGWTVTDAKNLLINATPSADQVPLFEQLIADIAFYQKEYAQAFALYTHVNQSKLASALSFFSAAKANQQNGGDLSLSIALLDSAINKYVKPYPSEASQYIFERAEYKMELALYQDAVADYDLYYYTADGRVNDLFYFYRARAKGLSNQLDEAIEDVNQAIKINNQEPDYYAELASLLVRKSNLAEAINAANHALELNKEYAACYRIIGYCLLKQNKKEDACSNFAKAKELGDTAVQKLIDKNCN